MQSVETFVVKWVEVFVFELSRMLATAGVPEEYQLLGAFGVLYLAMTLFVVVLLLVFLSVIRRPGKKRKKLALGKSSF